jgi:uncharacterized protein YhbP (UPF0306 family)
MINNLVGRVLRRVGIENDLYLQWQGLNQPLAVRAQPAAENIPDLDSEFYALPAMSLATQATDGPPHAATVYFAADEQRRNLYFFSDQASQHSQDLAVNPRAAVTIEPLASDWREIRGLQLRGEVALVPAGEAWEHAWQIYQEKFPFVKDLREIVTRNALYSFRPNWVRRSDNRRGFGYKEEWTL